MTMHLQSLKPNTCDVGWPFVFSKQCAVLVCEFRTDGSPLNDLHEFTYCQIKTTLPTKRSDDKNPHPRLSNELSLLSPIAK